MKHLLPFLLALSAFAQTPVATPTVGTWYHLQNKAGLCLSAPDSHVRMQTCSAIDPAQSFLMTALAGGYGFVAQSTGMVLDIYGEGKTSGVPLDTYFYTGRQNQIFALTNAGNGYFYVKPTHDNLCLETTVANAAAPNSTVVQWTCLNGSNQQWQFVAYGVVPAGTVSIIVNPPAAIAASEADPGVIDGVNQLFTLGFAPIGGVRVYLNGVHADPSGVTVNGKVVNIGFAPEVNDHVFIDYEHN